MSDAYTKITLDVIKRNGKKVSFDASKIALAIKKGFDNVVISNDTDEEKKVYTEKDVNKVYLGVIKAIEKKYKDETRIKIEEIQDLIEAELEKQGYNDVKSSFSEYREMRNRSRELFSEDKHLHKFLKTLEGLGLKSANEDDTKRENANIDGDSAMGTMLQYGSTVSKEFAKTYLMKKRFSQAHDEGDIHVHDMDFLAMGTTTCMQIELDRLFKHGFSTGHGHLRTPASISSYSALAAIAIQSNQNDQHGGQSIPAFDYYMAPGVLKTFKKGFKQQVYDLLDYEDLLSFINMDRIAKEIDKLTSIEFPIEKFEFAYGESGKIKRLFEKCYDRALVKTNRQTYQAMEAFVHNLNTMHSRAGAQVPFSSVNFGTDITPEGRMVIKNFLEATEAGLGSGAIASSTTDEKSPVRIGLIQILGIYFVSFIICTSTAFIILTSDYLMVPFENINGIELTQYALHYHLGNFGIVVLVFSIISFAFSTIIAGYYYGESNLKYLKKNMKFLEEHK